jgi:hypothetical protein
MSGETNSDLSRALQRVTIFQIWREAGLPSCPDRDGVYRSPFREDRTASFSVGGQGKIFKDWGRPEVAGGLIQFAKLAWPNLGEEEIKDALVDLAGTRTHRAPAAAPVIGPDGKPQAPAVVIPTALLKAAKNLDKKIRLAEAEERIYQEREEQLRPQIEEGRRILPAWPDCVRDRYLDGVAMMATDPKLQEKLAKERGWPVQWIEELVALELVSYAWERGCDAGGRWARRQKAFRVDFPQIEVDEHGARAVLQPIGYHQRFFMPAKRAGEAPTKGWMYLPGFPKHEPRSEYERAIVAEGQRRGLKWEAANDRSDGVREKFLAGLPFVLGDLVNTRTVIILEGQWDAISLFGACGWFHDTTPAAGVAVFGIRGADGMDCFLGYWRRWLRANAPLAWVIADNDDAGRGWREAPPAKPGHLQPPSLAERLADAGCRDVKVSWLKEGPWGKDFNDYYKMKKPSPAKMWKWMRDVGVLDSAGGWA